MPDRAAITSSGFFRQLSAGLSATFGRKAFDYLQVGMQGRPQQPDRDVNNLLDQYERNEIVYAAINRKAMASIDVRCIVETRSGPKAEWQEETGHPFRRLMMQPNPMMDESDFLAAYIVSMEVAGIFYAEKVFEGGLPSQLWPLDPSKISPIPRAGGLVDYQFRDGTYREIIPAERMLVKRRFNPRKKYQGLSPLAVALGSIDADTAQTDFIRDFFNNAGVPSGILKVGGRINQQTADELRAKWRMRLGRIMHRQHDITVLDESAEYQKVGSGLNEIASQDIRSFTESRVAMAFDVPPLIIYAYVGLLRATYDNLKGAWQGFWTASLKPMYRNTANFLTWRLLTDFEDVNKIYAETIRLRFDLSEVEWLQESANEKKAQALQHFQGGGLTRNEYRTQLGEQSDPAGDFYILPFNMIAIPTGTEPEQDQEKPPANDTVQETGKRLRDQALRRQLKAAGRATIQKRIEKSMKALLASQYEAVAAAVEAA